MPVEIPNPNPLDSAFDDPQRRVEVIHQTRDLIERLRLGEFFDTFREQDAAHAAAMGRRDYDADHDEQRDDAASDIVRALVAAAAWEDELPAITPSPVHAWVVEVAESYDNIYLFEREEDAHAFALEHGLVEEGDGWPQISTPVIGQALAAEMIEEARA